MAHSRDFIVGLFVIVALLILAVITVSLRQLDVFGSRNTYYVLFREVKRLDTGAPVLASGVKVGEVTNLEFIGGDHPVRVTMKIDRVVQLYSNAEIRVIPAQVIGDTTVNVINNGSPERGATAVPPGGQVLGTETPELEATITKVSEQMSDVLSGAAQYFNDPQNQVAVKRALVNIANVSEKMDKTFALINNEFMPLIANLKRTANSLDSFLRDAQKLTNQASGEMSKTTQSFRDTAADYSQAADTLTREIKTTSERLQQTIGQLQQTINQNQQPLNTSLKEIGEASRALNDVLEKIQKGEGTLGKLVNDPRPFEQLRQLLEGLSAKLTGRRESIFPIVNPQKHTPVPLEPSKP